MDDRTTDRSAIEETAGDRPIQPGEPPANDGVGSDPVRPSERSTYGSDSTGGEESVAAEPSSPPGVAIGVLLLVLFVAILAWAVIAGLR
jgi:hypothetical protein